ncbi:LutC/YkgG family protein [Thermophagus sp. OGC60D27]|uniref:LutC/YkgG family protein n=1 Tax=Thermophagus sp. OGC60D27 TaxID=3458415 RepID=UPI004038191C
MKDPINNSNSKEIILSKLRNSKPRSWEMKWQDEVPDGEVFERLLDPLSSFIEELEGLGGQVFIEKNEEDAWLKLKLLLRERGWEYFVVEDGTIKDKCLGNDIPIAESFSESDDSEVGLTGCEALVALTGSVMVSSSASGRKMNIFPSIHVVLAAKDQLVHSIKDGFERIEAKYGHRPSQISLISGPSRTADIEKTLVMGAHGPRELIVVIYN